MSTCAKARIYTARTVFDAGPIRRGLIGDLRCGMVPRGGAHIETLERFVVMENVTVPGAHFVDAAEIVLMVVQGRL